MYQHADQSWKSKPKTLSLNHQQLFVDRLTEYVQFRKLERVLIVYHGGEPLLFGIDNLINFSKEIRSRLSTINCKVDFGIQTNGVLLKKMHLEALQEHSISVSLSIDGPKDMHDQHRLDLKNRPTFDKVYASLQLLKQYPKIFTGCIAVINPHFSPRKLFEFFDENGVSEFNILIPDANHVTPPLGREENPSLYKDWLISAFDCWFDEFSHLKCKYFDWLMRTILGFPSATDSFGLGDINLIVLETDGTYHNHDVLKITKEGNTSLGMGLETHAIADVEHSEIIQFHRKLLTKQGLSAKCQTCRHVDVCGGGFIAHRYDTQGYQNPSVYCDELYTLISHITHRLTHKLKSEVDRIASEPSCEFGENLMGEFWNCKTSGKSIKELQDYRARKNFEKLQSVIPFALSKSPGHRESIEACKRLSFEELRTALLHPTANAWLRVVYLHSIGLIAKNAMNQELPLEIDYFDDFLSLALKERKNGFTVQSDDRWYRYSLSSHIVLDHAPEVYQAGLNVLNQALEIIKDFDSDLFTEMQLISPNILMIKDVTAYFEKDVSLSDMTLPGAVFVGVWAGNQLFSPYIVAASLIHEHMHQKLYLLQNRFQLFKSQETLIYSPWTQTMRPPEGVLHAVYVFLHVAQFWQAMIDKKAAENLASKNLAIELERLEPCLASIKNEVKFTEIGSKFFACALEKFEVLNSHPLILGR